MLEVTLQQRAEFLNSEFGYQNIHGVNRGVWTDKPIFPGVQIVSINSPKWYKLSQNHTKENLV